MNATKKNEKWLNRDLLRQFTSPWKMLEEAIHNTSEEHWYQTDND